ncbi:MAG: AAA family ATPase [Desulfobacterales bacterium]|nr:MAG: AAA family ATPase [Desulfobacterales bacterium]
MKCPECQFDNREGAKFCIDCGNKLEINCSKCSHLNPPASKFCEECGSRLNLLPEQAPQELSFDEKITKIQKYLPKGLTDKILAQKDRIEGERKQVTVMFCDMEGFTSLSEKLGSEEAYAIMDQIYEILIHKVHDYEGTVNEFTGDGIMALFGAPIALEDAPQRAIRSAYAIHREMSKFSDKIKQDRVKIPPLKMRIGIHTGPVVVGTLGNDLRVEFKAVGDTVNLASRVEGLAESGTTYVTEDTFRLSEGFFRFEALGKKEIKGKDRPIRVYRVIAPSTRRTRFDVSAERGLTPLVGRDRELEILLDAFEWAKRGEGQAVSIMSEAGLGKSRLLYEFRKAVVNEDATFLEGKCLSYSRGVAYHPVIDILKSNFNVKEGDREAEIKEKVRNGLKVLDVDETSTLPYLLALLSVKDSSIDKIPISAEARKERIIEALIRISLKGSEIRPLVMAIEDLHWIDKSSEDALKTLLGSIAAARIFIIFTFRPEFTSSWDVRSYHGQINLNRLSKREGLAMVINLLGTTKIDMDLEELILHKTEGVPFFIEEFVKSLKELKLIEKSNNRYQLTKDAQKVTIPSTINDVIMARVDRLPEKAKSVLQTGVVIGREFNHDILKRVTGLPERELQSTLSLSRDIEVIYEQGVYPETFYIFKHALTREVLYESIITRKKKEIHQLVAHAIEDLYRDNIEAYYGVLAQHFIDGEDYEKGAEYSKLAGKNVKRAGSLNEAIHYALMRVSCLEKLPRTDIVERKIIQVRAILGIFLIDMNHFKRAEAIVSPITELALKGADQKVSAHILTVIGSCEYVLRENFPKAFDQLEKALRISMEMKDMATTAEVSYWLGCAQWLNCDFEKAEINISRSVEISKAAKRLYLESTFKALLSHLVYYYQGKIHLGYELSKDAVNIADDSGDITSKTFAYSVHGISCFGKGFFEEALEFLFKGREISRKLDQYWWRPWSNHSLGEVYFEIGEYQKARDHYEEAASLFFRYGNWPSFSTVSKIALAKAQMFNDEEEVNLDNLYGYVSLPKAKLVEGWIRRYISEILLIIDKRRIPEAEKWIKEAITADGRNGTLFELARDYLVYWEVLKRKGNETQALESLQKAMEIFRKCGADGWVEKYEKELVALS